jgi:arylsulfatase A-like enzyme
VVTRCAHVLACALGSVALGCGVPAGDAFDLRSTLEASGSKVHFFDPPAMARVAVDGETRPAVVTTDRGFEWRGRVPGRAARLHVGVQVLPEVAERVEALEVVVSAESGSSVEVLAVLRPAQGAPSRWLDADADLGRFAGAETRLRFEAAVRWKGERPEGPGLAWAPVTLTGAPTDSTDRPNVLVILIDTLRADHVGAYGYERATTPEIDRQLAQRGVLFERAYAQAPWTLPSVASLFTGVQPGRFLAAQMAAFSLPDDLASLPELMAARGYATAGFVANPTLHAGIGFARGFATFYNPPLTLESMKRGADDLTPRVEAWLRAHQRQPFFLYAHYIDPHDPYLPPTLEGKRSPFLPDYAGPVTGDWVHGVYNGRLTLPDPARDVPQMVALYDAEIAYVDRHVGRLLDALDPEILARTLVLVTSDHGEELFDHGGWKHGQTLYEEQIRVPLVLRWDGRLEPARREAAPVALLDVLPTLAAAAGIERRAEWQGIDLLAGLERGVPARRPIVARHHASGPLRAAVISGDRKLVLFNRAEAFTPGDPLSAHLWRLDLGRLRRAERYDLSADPGERNNLERGDQAASPAVGELEALLFEELDQQGPGTRVVAHGLGAGEKAFVTIRFDQAPGLATPWFLGPEDRLVTAGPSIRLDLEGDGHRKGMLLSPSAARLLEIRADGLEVFVGADGTPLPGGRPEPAQLLAALAPRSAGRGLYVWSAAPAARRPPSSAEQRETIELLRALGYVN